MSTPRMAKNDQLKAKDAYSIHQDSLLWSRTQTLIAIQGAILAGAYSLRVHLELAVPLMFLGITLTLILWTIAERDQLHRDAAFGQSGVDPTLPYGVGVGRWLIRLVFDLMIVADGYLLLWIVLSRNDVWPTSALNWLGFAFASIVVVTALVGMVYLLWKLFGIVWQTAFPRG